jgi:hypothetical protein
MMPEGYSTQVGMKFVVKSDSMQKMADVFGQQMKRVIENVKMSIGVGAPSGRNLVEVQKSAQASSNVLGNTKLLSGIEKTLGIIAKVLAPLAIVATILGEILQFLEPFVKLAGFLILVLLIPVFRWLKENLQNLAAFFGFGGKKKEMLPGEGETKSVGAGLGVLIGGAIGGVSGGPIGAVIGAGIGALIAGAAVDFGIWLGKALWDNIINPLITFGMELGQGFIDWYAEFSGHVQAFIANVYNAVVNLPADLEAFGKWLFETIKTAIGDLSNTLGSVSQWLWDNVITPLGNAIKVGIDNLLGTNWTDILKYAFAKLYQFIINGVNGIINILKSIKLPTFQGLQWGRIFGFTVPTGVNWGETSPFAGIGNVTAPESVTSTIADFESRLKGMRIQNNSGTSVNYQPTYNIEAGVNNDTLLKLLKQYDDNARRDVFGRISYVTSIKP